MVRFVWFGGLWGSTHTQAILQLLSNTFLWIKYIAYRRASLGQMMARARLSAARQGVRKGAHKGGRKGIRQYVRNIRFNKCKYVKHTKYLNIQNI